MSFGRLTRLVISIVVGVLFMATLTAFRDGNDLAPMFLVALVLSVAAWGVSFWEADRDHDTYMTDVWNQFREGGDQ